MRYDCLIVDAANTAHRVFDHKKETPKYVSKKQVYKKAICNFISFIDSLEETYLHDGGDVYMLFDNSTSRIDLQSTFYFASRKEAYAKYKRDRAKYPKEFYNSLNLLKYYYLTKPAKYHTTQIPMLEADDLVEPLLRTLAKDKTALLVTNDLDWARYLSSTIHWLPRGTEVEVTEALSDRLGFFVDNKSITAYKVLFGDPSDNIPAIVGKKAFAEFVNILCKIEAVDDLLYLAASSALVEDSLLLKGVAENERQFRINLQLVNAIPVADSHFLNATGTGRDSVVSQRAVEQAVGLIDASEGFKFGGVRRPRV